MLTVHQSGITTSFYIEFTQNQLLGKFSSGLTYVNCEGTDRFLICMLTPSLCIAVKDGVIRRDGYVGEMFSFRAWFYFSESQIHISIR